MKNELAAVCSKKLEGLRLVVNGGNFVDYFGIHGILMAQRVFVWSKIQNIPY